METKKPNIHCYRPTNLSVQAIPHLRRPLAICTLGGIGKGQGRSSEKWSLNDHLGNLIEFTTISIFAYCLQGSSLSVSGNLVIPSVSYLPLMWLGGHDVATDGIFEDQCNCNGCSECPGEGGDCRMHCPSIAAGAKTVQAKQLRNVHWNSVNSSRSSALLMSGTLWPSMDHNNNNHVDVTPRDDDKIKYNGRCSIWLLVSVYSHRSTCKWVEIESRQQDGAWRLGSWMRVDQHLQCSLCLVRHRVDPMCDNACSQFTCVWTNLFSLQCSRMWIVRHHLCTCVGSMCSLCSVQCAIYSLVLIRCATRHASARIKECATSLQVFSLASGPIYNILVRR